MDREECTWDRPYDKDNPDHQGLRWSHPYSKEVGEFDDFHSTYVKMRCPVCKKEFEVELPD